MREFLISGPRASYTLCIECRVRRTYIHHIECQTPLYYQYRMDRLLDALELRRVSSGRGAGPPAERPTQRHRPGRRHRDHLRRDRPAHRAGGDHLRQRQRRALHSPPPGRLSTHPGPPAPLCQGFHPLARRTSTTSARTRCACWTRLAPRPCPSTAASPPA